MIDMFIYVGLGLIGLFIVLGLISQKGRPKSLGESGRLDECGSSPNCVVSEAGGQPERAVAPIRASRADMKAAIIATGGTITSEREDYMSATYMSRLFKFVDDLEVRVENDELLHIRSASRVGYSDRGVNRRRVEALRAYLKKT